MSITPEHDAIRFLKAIFQPQDLILFRPIETWKQDGKKRSEVDYPGVRYERFGGRAGGTWEWFDSRMVATVSRIIDRTETTRANLFFGTCPRFGGDGKFDLAWQIRAVRTLWADIDDALPDVAKERCQAAGVPVPSIVVASGNGTHLYWVLGQPALVDDVGDPPPVHTDFVDRGPDKPKKRQLYLLDPKSKERLSLDARQNVPELSARAQLIQDTIAGIAGKIGGDHTIDLSRILRIPGTLNRKDQRNGRAPTECRLVELTDRCYTLADFKEFAQQSPARAKRAKVAQVPLPKKRSSAKTGDRLRELITACAAAEMGRRSEADFALCCYAVEIGQDASATWDQVSGVGKFAEAGQRYFDATWDAAQHHTREKLFSKTIAKEKQKEERKEKEAEVTAAGGVVEPVTNGYREGDDPEAPTLPLEMPAIITRILERTDNWPRRIGSGLFVHDKARNAVDHLGNADALFGWLATRCGIVEWVKGQGFVTKGEIFEELRRTAMEYKAIEYLPHWPPIEGHYYACEFPPPGNGEAMKGLLDRFCPSTPEDRKLILMLFATPFWGGRGGARPGFIVTGKGRGIGKSKLTELASRLAGGYIEVREYEDAAVMRQRLLSEEAVSKRIARLDNVKSLKFSWSDLESTMTAEVLSGKRMYYGETSRPNTLTWLLTLNGISLSTDMAQRCVIVHVEKPQHAGDWENETIAYVESHREALIGDILGFLQLEEKTPLKKHSRWGAWEDALLRNFPDANAICRIIDARSKEADTEFEEALAIEEFFKRQLEKLDYFPDEQKIHIPNSVAADWYRRATNNRNLVNSSACKIIHQFCEEERSIRLGINPTRKYGRGFLWNFQVEGAADYDLQDRIDEKKNNSAEEHEEKKF